MFFRDSIITSREHIALFGFVSSGLCLRLGSFAYAFLAPPKSEGPSFGMYSIFDMWEMMSPIYSFAGLAACLICFVRLSSASVVISLIPNGLLVVFFDRWFVDTRIRISNAAIDYPDFQFQTFDFALLNGSFIDLFTLVLCNMLVFWQLALIIRLIRERSR